MATDIAGSERGFVAGFERKVLFRIARFVAFTICFALFLGIVGGLVYLGKTQSRAEKPDAAELVQSLKPVDDSGSGSEVDASGDVSGPGDGTLGQQSPLVGLRVAPELQEVLQDPDNRRVLEGWIESMQSTDRQPFVDGLGGAVREARKHGVDDATAINAYHEAFQAYVMEREAKKLESVQSRLYIAATVVSVLLLLALFSLVLVLLAIERNTYRTANAATRP